MQNVTGQGSKEKLKCKCSKDRFHPTVLRHRTNLNMIEAYHLMHSLAMQAYADLCEGRILDDVTHGSLSVSFELDR